MQHYFQVKLSFIQVQIQHKSEKTTVIKLTWSEIFSSGHTVYYEVMKIKYCRIFFKYSLIRKYSTN